MMKYVYATVAVWLAFVIFLAGMATERLAWDRLMPDRYTEAER